MRRGKSAAALALLSLLVLAAGATAQERTFRLPGLEGGSLGPGDLGQGAVILVVWASWSPRGQDVVQRVNQLVETWGSQARVLTVVFQEDAATVRAFLAGKGLKAPVYLDTEGAFSKMHSVTYLPGMLVFKDGKIGFSGKLPPNPDPVIRQTLG